MSEGAFLFSLFAAAAVVLVLEIFLPSHGVLTVVGVGVLIGAIVKTFDLYGPAAGTLAVIASAVGLPVFAVAAVKIWPHTRIGRIIAPPNPVYGRDDFAPQIAELRALVGRTGQSLSPLRPVGTCEFDGRRLECICERGMVEAGVKVRAIGLRGRTLEVAIDQDDSRTV